MGGCGAAPLPGAPSSKYPTIPIAEATYVVLSQARVLPTKTVSLEDAQGYILAKPAHAPEPLPPFPASIKVRAMMSSRRRSWTSWRTVNLEVCSNPGCPATRALQGSRPNLAECRRVDSLAAGRICGGSFRRPWRLRNYRRCAMWGLARLHGETWNGCLHHDG
eukprot:5076912-Pyramimonas_sp.AAC.1